MFPIYDAMLYAKWCGCRLPSEIEWEKAARTLYSETNKAIPNKWPWGNIFKKELCNAESTVLLPVGQFPEGKSYFGILDMAGNVWEWTTSWYDIHTKKNRVIRGGGFRSPPYQARISYREGFFPQAYRDDIGFRCVRDP